MPEKHPIIMKIHTSIEKMTNCRWLHLNHEQYWCQRYVAWWHGAGAKTPRKKWLNQTDRIKSFGDDKEKPKNFFPKINTSPLKYRPHQRDWYNKWRDVSFKRTNRLCVRLSLNESQQQRLLFRLQPLAGEPSRLQEILHQETTQI